MDLVAPLTKDKLNTILTELHFQLEDHYGPRLVNLILYGSQARGDAQLASEIDVSKASLIDPQPQQSLIIPRQNVRCLSN